MAIKKYKPTSPGRRSMSTLDTKELSKKRPEKKLTEPLSKKGGRNNNGRITVRRRGGGHKRKYRIIDFKRNKVDVPGIVEAIEYDPNRSARIALIKYLDGEKNYIICANGLNVGDSILAGENIDIQPGNCLPIHKIPLGTIVHNIEMKIGKGGQLVRSAGTGAQLLAKEGKYAHILMPSGEVRLILQLCRACIGQVGNLEHENIRIGKAGRVRWMGKRPKVRGVAMNPVDHPHGGGEGRSSGGRHPVTPWGISTKGHRTRSNRSTDKFIVRRRKKK